MEFFSYLIKLNFGQNFLYFNVGVAAKNMLDQQIGIVEGVEIFHGDGFQVKGLLWLIRLT